MKRAKVLNISVFTCCHKMLFVVCHKNAICLLLSTIFLQIIYIYVGFGDDSMKIRRTKVAMTVSLFEYTKIYYIIYFLTNIRTATHC